MKYLNLPIGEVIIHDHDIEWKRTNIRDNESTYKDNYYYMPIECFCDVDCTGCGYTVMDECGPCDYCESTIRQINGHNDEINVDFDNDKLFEEISIVTQTNSEKTKLYKIAVSWTETGVVLTKGNNLESAIKKAEKGIDNILLPDGEYLNDSFQIDKDTTKLLNKIKTTESLLPVM